MKKIPRVFQMCLKINDAIVEKDHKKSVEKWRKLFGDDFGKLHNPQKTGAIAGGGVAAIPTVPATRPYAHD